MRRLALLLALCGQPAVAALKAALRRGEGAALDRVAAGAPLAPAPGIGTRPAGGAKFVRP